MRTNVVSRVMDVRGRLRHEGVKHVEQILRDTLFIGENGQGAGRMLRKETADAIVYRRDHGCNLLCYVDYLLVILGMDGDEFLSRILRRRV